MVRILKEMGVNDEELLDVYCKQIRIVLEYAKVVWLTVANTSSIDRVQKACLAIILGQRYISYSSIDRQTGHQKRGIVPKICKKCHKNPKFSSWFVEDNKIINTR